MSILYPRKTPSLCIEFQLFFPVLLYFARPTHLLSGASGNLSIVYLPFATLTIGTPGIFLNLLFKSTSLVPTR